MDKKYFLYSRLTNPNKSKKKIWYVWWYGGDGKKITYSTGLNSKLKD
jgi:hypothetical protein